MKESEINDHGLSPGDEAVVAALGADERICPECDGSGTLESGAVCPACTGTGHVLEKPGAL